MATTVSKQALPARFNAHVVRNAAGDRVMAVSLADPEMGGYIEALKAKVTADSASSKQFLKSIGIMNRSGKTAKKFGG